MIFFLFFLLKLNLPMNIYYEGFCIEQKQKIRNVYMFYYFLFLAITTNCDCHLKNNFSLDM